MNNFFRRIIFDFFISNRSLKKCVLSRDSILSIAELACASCKLIVSINKVGFGKFVIAPFNSESERLAVITFLRIFFVSTSVFGGKSGNSLNGFSGSYVICF